MEAKIEFLFQSKSIFSNIISFWMLKFVSKHNQKHGFIRISDSDYHILQALITDFIISDLLTDSLSKKDIDRASHIDYHSISIISKKLNNIANILLFEKFDIDLSQISHEYKLIADLIFKNFIKVKLNDPNIKKKILIVDSWHIANISFWIRIGDLNNEIEFVIDKDFAESNCAIVNRYLSSQHFAAVERKSIDGRKEISDDYVMPKKTFKIKYKTLSITNPGNISSECTVAFAVLNVKRDFGISQLIDILTFWHHPKHPSVSVVLDVLRKLIPKEDFDTISGYSGSLRRNRAGVYLLQLVSELKNSHIADLCLSNMAQNICFLLLQGLLKKVKADPNAFVEILCSIFITDQTFLSPFNKLILENFSLKISKHLASDLNLERDCFRENLKKTISSLPKKQSNKINPLSFDKCISLHISFLKMLGVVHPNVYINNNYKTPCQAYILSDSLLHTGGFKDESLSNFYTSLLLSNATSKDHNCILYVKSKKSSDDLILKQDGEFVSFNFADENQYSDIDNISKPLEIEEFKKNNLIKVEKLETKNTNPFIYSSDFELFESLKEVYNLKFNCQIHESKILDLRNKNFKTWSIYDSFEMALNNNLNLNSLKGKVPLFDEKTIGKMVDESLKFLEKAEVEIKEEKFNYKPKITIDGFCILSRISRISFDKLGNVYIFNYRPVKIKSKISYKMKSKIYSEECINAFLASKAFDVNSVTTCNIGLNKSFPESDFYKFSLEDLKKIEAYVKNSLKNISLSNCFDVDNYISLEYHKINERYNHYAHLLK